MIFAENVNPMLNGSRMGKEGKRHVHVTFKQRNCEDAEMYWGWGRGGGGRIDKLRFLFHPMQNQIRRRKFESMSTRVVFFFTLFPGVYLFLFVYHCGWLSFLIHKKKSNTDRWVSAVDMVVQFISESSS